MTTRVVAWGRDELAWRADDVLDVYAEAMGVDRRTARARRSVLESHVERDGVRARAALDDERLVGIAYGYFGAPGQWWHDHVGAALGREASREWLDGAFEVCELHVRPGHQRGGLGRSLLEGLLEGPVARTAVLSTPDRETRARGFYRSGGWVDLVRGLRFPGDIREFAVLGKALRAPE